MQPNHIPDHILNASEPIALPESHTSTQEGTVLIRFTRRQCFESLGVALGAMALASITPFQAVAAPRRRGKGSEAELKLTPEEEKVQWAQGVLKQFGLETREEQIAFCKRWLTQQGNEAYIYLPANIGAFYKKSIGSNYAGKRVMERQEEYWAVREDSSYALPITLSGGSYSDELQRAPSKANPIGHESNVDVMQIELAQFCLKYEAELREGNFDTIGERKPTILGFYPLNKEAVPPTEDLRKLPQQEVFAAFGLNHPGSRRLFVEALQEGFKLEMRKKDEPTKDGDTRLKELMTGTAEKCADLGCVKVIDDEIARFLILNRDALLEEPIDLNKLRTPFL